MKISLTTSLIIFVLFGLFLLWEFKLKEGFEAGVPAVRCGVDLPTCAVGKQCMNGFCGYPSAPALPPNQLPVFP